MKISKYIMPTLKEDPSDAVVKSHRLMVRAGLIRKESAGMYAYLPLGFRVLRKLTDIVREEMDKSGALEFLMPELTNAELWKESGRWGTMGPELFRIKDRNAIEYSLAPTHEEAFTSIVRAIISSYRDLPINVYQINTKFRDEIRPRYGVIRSKEFIMKDAYSFDIDQEGLDKSYETMRKVYRNIFKRCGLDTIPVQADSGAMGGSNSEEFMVASEVGEEVLLICNECTYRANQEKAEYKRSLINDENEQAGDLEKVHTPDVKTIEDLISFFKIPAEKFLKSILYMADNKPVLAVVTGDREINEHKLKNYLGAVELELASEEDILRLTGAPVGFAGPVTDKPVKTVCDLSVRSVNNAITGANEKDYHLKGVQPGRDFNITDDADITSAAEGDLCPKCGSPMYEKKGIEVGHIFKLGYKYTEGMKVRILDEKGSEITPIMGCYGIGVNRTMAAVVEQHNDDRGIIWPMSIAPFQVHMIGITKKEEDKKTIDTVYKKIMDEGIDVLYDDRDASPGFKFADADLIGIPIRITLGKGFFETGEIEIKLRKEKEIRKVPSATISEELKDLINELGKPFAG